MVGVAMGIGLGALAGGAAARAWAGPAETTSGPANLSSLEPDGRAPVPPKAASRVGCERLNDLLLQLSRRRLHVFQLENQVLEESYRMVAGGIVEQVSLAHATEAKCRIPDPPKVASGEASNRQRALLLLLFQLGRGRRHVFQLENQVLEESYRKVVELQALLKVAEERLSRCGETTHREQRESPHTAAACSVEGTAAMCDDDELVERIQQAVAAYLHSPSNAIPEETLNSDSTQAEEEEDDEKEEREEEEAEQLRPSKSCPVKLPSTLEDSGLQHQCTFHSYDIFLNYSFDSPWNVQPETSSCDTTCSREARRARQISIGKSRPEYQRYIEKMPLEDRGPLHPHTPNASDHVPNREFNRKVAKWRRQLRSFGT